MIMYILLCGYPPFKGKNHKEIFDKIKTGKFSFAASEWKSVTREAKVMIKRMLTYEPEERISAEQALNQEWIVHNSDQEEGTPNEKFHEPVMSNIVRNLKQIRVEEKLQQAVLTYIANFMHYDSEKQKMLDIFKAFDKNGDG